MEGRTRGKKEQQNGKHKVKAVTDGRKRIFQDDGWVNGANKMHIVGDGFENGRLNKKVRMLRGEGLLESERLNKRLKNAQTQRA
mmetsp:Transcript_91113/g.190554  ORF Transcript_91113/g.190554 Transcript_91113/m.190554 type:complete len:84 (-) Transcript_91113:111-362(-)